MGAGIDHGGVEFLMPQETLNGCDTAAGIEQLRRARMSEAMRMDLDPDPFANRF
jgi:hypothetical protein